MLSTEIYTTNYKSGPFSNVTADKQNEEVLMGPCKLLQQLKAHNVGKHLSNFQHRQLKPKTPRKINTQYI